MKKKRISIFLVLLFVLASFSVFYGNDSFAKSSTLKLKLKVGKKSVVVATYKVGSQKTSYKNGISEKSFKKKIGATESSYYYPKEDKLSSIYFFSYEGKDYTSITIKDKSMSLCGIKVGMTKKKAETAMKKAFGKKHFYCGKKYMMNWESKKYYAVDNEKYLSVKGFSKDKGYKNGTFIIGDDWDAFFEVKLNKGKVSEITYVGLNH